MDCSEMSTVLLVMSSTLRYTAVISLNHRRLQPLLERLSPTYSGSPVHPSPSFSIGYSIWIVSRFMIMSLVPIGMFEEECLSSTAEPPVKTTRRLNQFFLLAISLSSWSRAIVGNQVYSQDRWRKLSLDACFGYCFWQGIFVAVTPKHKTDPILICINTSVIGHKTQAVGWTQEDCHTSLPRRGTRTKLQLDNVNGWKIGRYRK